MITCTPGVRSGWPCIAGTRIGVEHVWGYVNAGMTVAEVAEFYEQPIAVIEEAVAVYEGMRPLFEAFDRETEPCE